MYKLNNFWNTSQYKNISRNNLMQIANEPPQKKYRTIKDSNGVIIDRVEDNSYLSDGGGGNRYLYEQTIPYMSQSINIFKKKGINVNVSFTLYTSYERINYYGKGELRGDTLIAKLQKELKPNLIGDTLFGHAFTVNYLVYYDYHEDEHYLYYNPELNESIINQDTLLWKEEKSLRINNAIQ